MAGAGCPENPTLEPIRVLITGTYRTGGNFLAERLSTDPEVLIPADFVHFFRFIYGRYHPRDAASRRRLFADFAHRLERRFGFDLRPHLPDPKTISGQDGALFCALEALVRILDGSEALAVFGEKTAQDWPRIGTFLDLFPQARAIHLVRDPRAVLHSWRRVTIQPAPLYLDALFNALDSLRTARSHATGRHAERIRVLRYERLIGSPADTMEELCAFLGRPFDAARLDAPLPTSFRRRISGTFSIQGSRRPFAAAAREAWREGLSAAERWLADRILGPELEAFGYERDAAVADAPARRAIIRALEETPYLREQWRCFQAGAPVRVGYPTDPRHPSSWGPRGIPARSS